MTKIVVIVLVLIAGIFVFASARRQPTGDYFQTWLNDHKQALDRTSRVKLEDVEFPGRNDDILVLGSSLRATLIVAERRGSGSRKLTLAPSTPGKLRIRFDPAANETVIMPVPERDFDQNHPAELLIGERGGSITLTQVPPMTGARIKLR